MSWGEAVRLTGVLSADPSTAVAAAVAGWEYPISRTAMAVADLYDLQHASKTRKRPKPYPRPWGDREHTHRGTGSYTTHQLRAVLTATRALPTGGE